METLMRHAKLTMLLMALTVGATQVALADAADGVPLSRQVNYSDLDMSQVSGAKTLYRRLVLAADAVCERYEDLEISRMQRYKTCVRHSLSVAIADVNNPLLTSYYESKVGAPALQVAKLDN
jgi:UrcA family protein